MAFLTAMLMGLLPRSWWGKWQPESTVTLRHAALAEGGLQLTVCLVLLVWRYVLFFAMRAQQLSAVAHTNEGTQLYYSFIVTLEYALVHPLSLLLEYVALEGLVRALTAWTSGEVAPNWMLRLLAWTAASAAGRRAETARGTRVADAVLPGDGKEIALRIASCRPKSWTPALTISFRDELFELVREEEGTPPHRHVYLLRKSPSSKIVRGLHTYDPEEVMRPR